MALFASLKWFARRESREISVMALARLFERSEFRSHMKQISDHSLANLSPEAAFFGSFLWHQRNEHKRDGDRNEWRKGILCEFAVTSKKRR